MAIINPTAVTLNSGESQQFTTDISSPVWSVEGLGLITQSGGYTAPSSFGSDIVKAGETIYASYDASKLTKGTDDRLTVIATGGSFPALKPKLNSIGDYFEVTWWNTASEPEFILTQGSIQWLVGAGGRYAYQSSPYELVGLSSYISFGSKVRLQLASGNTIQVYVDGILRHTFSGSFTPGTPISCSLYVRAENAVGTVINRPVVGGSGITNYTEVQANVTIDISIDSYIAGDPLIQIVPKADLQAWHAANKYSQTASLILPDLSGNGRHLQVDTNLPQIQPNILNQNEAVYFNGSTHNPFQFDGDLIVKHIFIVGSLEDATFTANLEGLLSDLATNGILVGQSNTATKWYDLLHPNYTYKKSEVEFADNNQQAPVDSNFAVMEIVSTDGFNLDGIQIGRDRDFTTRRWKGWFGESMMYSEIKNEIERAKIYEYFAMKYHLWSKNVDGLNIFPFPANRSRSSERELEHYLSEPYEGNSKALIRGSLERSLELPFELRLQHEYEAVEQFHSEHYPLTKFIFKDYRYNPYQERLVEFTSGIREQGSDVSYRFNYSFRVSES